MRVWCGVCVDLLWFGLRWLSFLDLGTYKVLIFWHWELPDYFLAVL